MSQVLNLNTLSSSYSTRPESYHIPSSTRYYNGNQNQQWTVLLQKLNCKGRISCLFSDNRREEQARKALESALGGKKSDFEKWGREIKRREEAGGGGNSGGGGWFGSGGRFGWSNGDNFWREAQQTSLTVLGIILLYLVVAKGEVLLAVTFNPLLFALRGMRDWFTFITSQVLQKGSPNGQANSSDTLKKESYSHLSAKESVVRKWGSD